MSQVQLSSLLTKKTETWELKGVVHYEHNPPIIARVTSASILHYVIGPRRYFPPKRSTRSDDSYLFLSVPKTKSSQKKTISRKSTWTMQQQIQVSPCKGKQRVLACNKIWKLARSDVSSEILFDRQSKLTKITQIVLLVFDWLGAPEFLA